MMNNNSFLSGSDDWRCITPPKSRRSPNGCPNNPDLWKYDPLSSCRSSGSSLQSGSSGGTPSPDLSLDFDRGNSPGLLSQSTLSSGREIRCRNCTELMCLDCLRFQNNEVSPQIDGWTNSADRFSSFPTFSPDRDCWNMKCSHVESLWYYCQTCSMPFCSTCNTRTHFNHEYSSLKEAWEDARQKSRQTVTEATYHLNLLQNEEERGLLATIQLDQRAREAASLVTSAFARIIAAAESRKMELLGRIQELRRQKYLDLKARSDMVTKMIKDLKDCIDLIVTSLDTALIFNPTDLYIIKDTANPHIFRSRMFQNIQPRVDESWISFHGPDHRSISQMLQSHGSIQTTNPRSSQRRQMPIREEGSEQELPANLSEYRAPLMTVRESSQSRALTPRPRGRPIPLSIHRVVSRFNRNEPVTVFGNVCKDSRDNLCRPWGVTCDRDGKILVADRSNNRILIFFQDGTLARCFGSHGTALGQFDRPAGIAVDSRKRIIVADKDNHRIQVLNYEGRCIFAFGEKGSGDGQFNYPWDVSVNTECEIVVSDTRNHRVQLFSPEGVFLRKFGFENQPNLWKTFDSPRGVAFTPEGKVLVTDFNNHRIFSIDYDFMNGHAFACTDNNGNTNNKLFLRPQGLVVDDDGNIIVADSRNHRIQAFNSSGRILWKFGTHGSGPREMDRPSGIALTPDGKVIVVDFGNNRVLLI